MRKVFLLLTLSFLFISLNAQRASRIHRNHTASLDQAIRAKILGGYILPITTYGDTTHTPSAGAELSYEFFTNNTIDWAVHWRRPIIGIAAQGIYLGNNDVMGQLFTLFPYARWELTRSEFFIYSMRVGAGIGAVTKTNKACASNFGFVANYNMEFQINITGYDWILFDLGCDAFTSCEMFSPSSPIILPYASFGYMRRFAPYQSLTTNEISRPYTSGLPYTFMLNLSAEVGGYNNWNSLRIDSHVDLLGKATNCWATGVGFDCEISRQLPDDKEKLSNRIRGGVTWANRFTMDRFHFLLDWGIYIYDPVRPWEYFYEYKLRGDHAWNYFRIGAGIRLYDNLYAQVVVHTNGFHTEYTSFGLSYGIPIHHINKYDKKSQRFKQYHVWHPDEDDNGFKATNHNYIHRPIK